jgi:hypothetical protein
MVIEILRGMSLPSCLERSTLDVTAGRQKVDERGAVAISRRTTLQRLGVAAAAGAGAWAITEVAGAPPAAAANGGPLVIGTQNNATVTTYLTNGGPGASGDGLYVHGASGGRGISGVGNAPGGVGVHGFSYDSDGVVGAAASFGPLGQNGVKGVSYNPGASGVYGENNGGGYGVAGRSGGVGVLAENTAQGYGLLARSSGVAINGDSAFGTGVVGRGLGQSSIGVYGEVQGSAATGVLGNATSPTGVGVDALNPGGGVALRVRGKAAFSRSGKVTVPAGAQSTVKTGVALTSASLVLVTLQQRRPGVVVEAAVPNVTGSSFTVHLNKPVTTSTVLAWFVIS